MKLSFEQKLTVLFVIILAAIITIGLIAIKNNNAFKDTNYWVKHTEDVLKESENVLALAEDLESGGRGYVLTNDTTFLEPFVHAQAIIFAHIQELKDLTVDDVSQQQRVDSLLWLVDKKIDFENRNISLVKNGKKEEAARMVSSRFGKSLMDKIRRHVNAIQDEENGLLTARRIANENTRSALNSLMIALFGGLVLISVTAFLVILYTFRKRKLLEEENSQTSSFLNTILENLPNMIFVKEAGSLKFVRFNKAGEKLLGESRENLIGKNDYDFFPKDEADFFTTKDKEVLSGGIMLDIPEEPILTKDGERWLHTKKIPIADHTGAAAYLLGISEDITEQRQHAREVRELNAELHKTVTQLLAANKEMEAFTYSVSHDLRAPLRIIDGFGEILIKDYAGKLDEEGIRNLKVIMQNARHMGQLIDDLLNLSRLGRAQLSVKKVNMSEVVADVITALKVVDHNVKAQINIGPLKNADCDVSLIRQVWVNLISNALKYSGKKEQAIIDIGCETNHLNTVYYVKDNGVGFDMQYAHKLFGVFQRLHKISEFEGTGVGLALVHRIITKHNGKVWAEARVDTGASFYFTLG